MHWEAHCQLSVGVLSIRVGLNSFALATCCLYRNSDTAYILGDFRSRHNQCHTVVDMAFLVGGLWFKEVVSFVYLVGYDKTSGSLNSIPLLTCY